MPCLAVRLQCFWQLRPACQALKAAACDAAAHQLTFASAAATTAPGALLPVLLLPAASPVLLLPVLLLPLLLLLRLLLLLLLRATLLHALLLRLVLLPALALSGGAGSSHLSLQVCNHGGNVVHIPPLSQFPLPLSLLCSRSRRVGGWMSEWLSSLAGMSFEKLDS